MIRIWLEKQGLYYLKVNESSQKKELAIAFAFQFLQDYEMETSVETLVNVLTASGNANIVSEGELSQICKVVQGKDITAVFFECQALPVGGVTPVEKPKKEKPEEVELDMGDLFGGGSDDY